MGSALFITGTGTDVGKTALCLSVLLWARQKGLAPAYYKPVQCGGFSAGDGTAIAGDAEWIARVSPYAFPVQSSYRFSDPVSPHLAAERDGLPVNLEKLAEDLGSLSLRHDLVVCEGAGGAAVPLNRTGISLADFAADKRLPSLIAASPALGTLHHTLSTLAYLRSRNAPVAGFALCHRQTEAPEIFEDNVNVLRSLSALDYFGALPFQENLAAGNRLSPEAAAAFAAPLVPALDLWWSRSRR